MTIEPTLREAALPPTLAEVLDALQVFNPPRQSEGGEPWAADQFMAVTALPGFIHNVGRAWYATQPAPDTRRVVIARIDPGFRWDSDKLHHVPNLLIEFEPVPALSPNDAKGWRDRDALAAALLSKQPAPIAQQAAPAPTSCERQPYGDLRNAKWLDPECYSAGACQSLKFKAAPVRQPLTDEQLRDAFRISADDLKLRARWPDLKQFARAIEAAHGIGKTSTDKK